MTLVATTIPKDSQDFDASWLDEAVEESVVQWALKLHFDDIPSTVILQVQRAILDTLGTALGAHGLPICNAIETFCTVAFGGTDCVLWGTRNTRTSALGAALGNALRTDGLDMHDTAHYTNGHAGAALVPCALACVSLCEAPVSGRDFLVALTAGYEVAYRAGQALHETASDYHTSGAWNAVGCAIVCAKLLQLDTIQTLHAVGIAEYYGPRSPMMRVVALPSMLKDGSGQGALVGMQAVLLARAGFTGRGCAILCRHDITHLYANLGTTWRLNQYHIYKKYAVCYWAQPSIAATIELTKQHRIKPTEIASITCHTFREAVGLSQAIPTNTEEAQYCIKYAVAVAAFAGEVGPLQVNSDALQNVEILDLCARVQIVLDTTQTSDTGDPNATTSESASDALTANTAWAAVTTHEGKSYQSKQLARVPWDTLAGQAAPTDAELEAKCRSLGAAWHPDVLDQIVHACWNLPNVPDVSVLSHGMTKPPPAR